MLGKHGWYTEERESILTLPSGARLQSYPSQKASVFRSLTDVRFLLAVLIGNESDIRAVIDAYVAKNENMQIALISTPGSPYGLCPDLEKELILSSTRLDFHTMTYPFTRLKKSG